MKKIKKFTSVILTLFVLSCNNSNQNATNAFDAKCNELLCNLKITEKKLAIAEDDIMDLQTGSGKFKNSVCTKGPICEKHSELYSNRNLILDEYNKINKAFQIELVKSSSKYRTNYYSDILETLKIKSDSAEVTIKYLEAGTNGFEKCINGERCPNHNQLYLNRNSLRNNLDSIKLILNTLK